MAHLNIERVSLAARDREKEIQKKFARKKTIFVLITQYLEENGCVNTAAVLKGECNLNLNYYSVCDNITLESIVQDFESYHFLRYQKLPQIVKKGDDGTVRPNSNQTSKTFRCKSAPKQSDSCRKLCMESSEFSAKQSDATFDCTNFDSININTCPTILRNRGSEWQLLADIVMNDIGYTNKAVSWSDIIGLDRAKQVLKEAIIYPVKYKHLFPSDLTPWKSILLYGPTGTGKTSLAAAVATESEAVFFNVSASMLISKWRGDSEKLVKVLFELAKQYAPSVIFIDEMDSLISHRGPDHEASRRMKTEFFSQVDSLFSSDKNVFLLGATNIPWELDQAILRRMEKRLFIPLPDFENRILLFKKFSSSLEQTGCDAAVDYEALALASENFSAFDIELVCKEAKMNSLRKVFHKLENSNTVPVCVPNCDTLKMSDLLVAVRNARPSNVDQSEKYSKWEESSGCE